MSVIIFILSATPTVVAAPADYDANGNGTIERDEVILAIKDYFAGAISRDEVIEVIKYYFSGAMVDAGSSLELGTLSLTHGDPAVTVTLSPTFASAIDTYTANVENDVSSITVIAIPSDPDATVVIRIEGKEDPDGTVELLEGANVIEVEVTNEDGATSKTYTVTVVREAMPDPVIILELDVSPHGVVGYWSDGTADFKGTVTLTDENGGQSIEAQPVEVTCASDDGTRPELCHWRADLLGDGLATDSMDFRLRVPMGRVTLIFTYGGVNSTLETWELQVYVPERIVGIARETWDCYVDRTVDPTEENAFGELDFYGCGGWKSGTEVHKLNDTRSVVVWTTGDERYIDILRESIDELSPILNHDFKWTSQETQATFKAYVGIPREEWADYGLTGITPGLLGVGGFARSTIRDNGEVIPKEIVVWRTEWEWAEATPAIAKSIIIHELLHALTGVSHVSGRTASIMGYDSDLPKLSPIDEVLFGLNSHRLVKPGMTLSQVGDLVIYEEDLLDDSPPEPDAIDMVWRAASQLVDSGAVRFDLKGGWIGNCDQPFGTASDPAVLELGDFGGFLRVGSLTARYQDSDGAYWMSWSQEDLEWQYWIERGGSVERISREAFTDALDRYIWPGKLQRTLYALISHWDQEDVVVTHQEGTVTLQITLDESYESMWEWESGLSLEFTLVVDAETHEIESYKWHRSHPVPGYCHTYEEVAQSIDLGIEFAIPPEVAEADSRGGSYNSRLYEMTPPTVPDIKRPLAP